MDAELRNIFALQMKVTDDCIIEEQHSTISNREIVKQWEATVYKKLRNKLFNHATGDTFQEVLKEYLRILKERATNFKDKLLLKEAIVKHLNFFYLYYDEFSATRCANLNYVESILLIVCSLELEFVRHMRKNNFANKEYVKITNCVGQRIITYLTLYLLNEERRIFHVLLRLEYKCDSLAWKEVMHIVYRHYLTILPVRDYSDEGFCRHYLLFQKFKNITEKSKHEGMDKIMYFRFNKTPSCIKENKILRSILLPSDDSIADLVDVLADGQQAAVNMYFRYIEQNNEDGKSQAINIDSDDEEICENALNSFHSIEKQFDSLVKSENNVKTNFEDVGGSKASTDDDVVCIIEDDSDIEVIGDEEQIKTPIQNCPVTEPKSFLESISCSKEIVTAATSPTVNLPSVSSPVPNTKSTKVVEVQETTSLPPEDDSNMNNLMAKYLEYMQIEDTTTKSTTNETTPVDESNADTSKESENNCNTNTAVIQDSEKEINVINDKSVTLTHCASNNNNVQHKTSIELSNISNLNEGLNVHNCTCSCAHVVCSKSAETINNRTENCSVKTNSRTVEIQTESYDNCDVTCGLDTPPPSEDISTTCTDTVPLSDDPIMNENSSANLTEPQENLTLEFESSKDKTLVPPPVTNQASLHLLESIDLQVSNEKEIEEEPTCASKLDNAPGTQEKDNKKEQELPELSPSSNNEIDKNVEELQTDTVVTPADVIFTNYSSKNISNNEKYFESEEDRLMRDCHITDEESLDNVSLTIDEDNSELSLENDNATIENVSFVRKSPQIVTNFESFSKNSVENNLNKIKTSVNIENINKTNLNKPVKLNGNSLIFSEEIKNKTKPSNVLFTSNERVSAPLSLFSKFEQDQSNFSINSLLNEPIHSLNERAIEHSDNTNSSDSLSLSSYSRTYSTTKASSLNNSPVNSPISSPPYEYIQPQDFRNHVISIDDHLTNCEDVYSKSIPTSKINVIDTNTHKTNSNVLVKSSIISKPGTKRKRSDGGNTNKKPKVNFGNIETRLISPRPTRLITQELLELANESMQEYRIDNNDKKLVYSKPQILLQLDTQKQLESKIKDLQLCSVLINILEKKGMDKVPDKTCILDRFDYKKPTKEVVQSDLLANKQTESLTDSSYTTLSHGLGVASSISGHPTTSTLIYTSTPNISGSGRLHSNNIITKRSIDENVTRRKNNPSVLPYTRKVSDVRIPVSKRSRGRPKKDVEKKSNNGISSSSTFSYGSS